MVPPVSCYPESRQIPMDAKIEEDAPLFLPMDDELGTPAPPQHTARKSSPVSHCGIVYVLRLSESALYWTGVGRDDARCPCSL